MHFQRLQHDFINAIRHPNDKTNLVNIPAKRLQVYQELFFNNVYGFVSNAYPVLKSLYQESSWKALVATFFRQYQCTSPYFLDIAEHFLTFLQQDYELNAQDPVFLHELAHYEWAELHLATKHADEKEQPLAPVDVVNKPLALSSLAMVVAYPYAVHRISVEYQPEKAGEVQYYLLHRNKSDDVKFIILNQLTAALLQLLQQTPRLTLAQLVAQLQPLVPSFTEQELTQGAIVILQDFAVKGALVSFQAA